MAPPTLSDLATLAAEVAGTYAGEAAARIIVRHPRAARVTLELLERAGVPGTGWPLVALAALAAEDRSPLLARTLDVLELCGASRERVFVALRRFA